MALTLGFFSRLLPLVTKDQYKSIRKGFQKLANGKLGITRAQWIEIAKHSGVPDEEVAGATFDGFDIDNNGYEI